MTETRATGMRVKEASRIKLIPGLGDELRFERAATAVGCSCCVPEQGEGRKRQIGVDYSGRRRNAVESIIRCVGRIAAVLAQKGLISVSMVGALSKKYAIVHVRFCYQSKSS